MSKAGDGLVRCCNALGRMPSLVMCFLVILLQASFVDYYLVYHLSIGHLFWAAGDVIVILLVAFCFLVALTSPSQAQQEADKSGSVESGRARNYTIVWVTWAFMQILLSAKIIVICSTFSTELDEKASFFGPNTLKTSVALGSCIFVLLLTSQHDAPPDSDRRRYIEELTGTVIFDILDTADILDVLFDADERPGLASGIPEMVLAVASLNLLLPTVPLITLSRTKFGLEKLSKRMVYMHRLLMVMLVNVPNLLVRILLWHGFSVGVSPFVLKNLLIILMTAYEFYEHKKEKFEEHENEGEEEMEDFKDEPDNDKTRNGRNNNEERLRKSDSDVRGRYSPNRRRSHSPRHRYSDGMVHFDIESRMVTEM